MEKRIETHVRRQKILKIAVNAMRDPKECKLLKEAGYDAVDYNGLCTEPGTGLFALKDAEFEKELLRDRAAIEGAELEICQVHGVWPYVDTKPENWESKVAQSPLKPP